MPRNSYPKRPAELPELENLETTYPGGKDSNGTFLLVGQFAFITTRSALQKSTTHRERIFFTGPHSVYVPSNERILVRLEKVHRGFFHFRRFLLKDDKALSDQSRDKLAKQTQHPDKEVVAVCDHTFYLQGFEILQKVSIFSGDDFNKFVAPKHDMFCCRFIGTMCRWGSFASAECVGKMDIKKPPAEEMTRFMNLSYSDSPKDLVDPKEQAYFLDEVNSQLRNRTSHPKIVKARLPLYGPEHAARVMGDVAESAGVPVAQIAENWSRDLATNKECDELLGPSGRKQVTSRNGTVKEVTYGPRVKRARNAHLDVIDPEYEGRPVELAVSRPKKKMRLAVTVTAPQYTEEWVGRRRAQVILIVGRRGVARRRLAAAGIVRRGWASAWSGRCTSIGGLGKN
eukprot:tig00021339_g20398.t1